MSEREAKRLGRRPMEVGAGGGDLEKPLSLALAVGSRGAVARRGKWQTQVSG